MKSWNKAVTIGILAGIAGGLLCTGCGKKGDTHESDSSGGVRTPAVTGAHTTWTYKGTAFTAITVLAKEKSFFKKPGVMVTFYDENVAPGESIFKKNCVEVFFPAQDSGYGKPTSVSFHTSSGQTVQESSNAGYNGQLTMSGSTVSGKLDINKIGYDEDCSITGSFEAALAGQ